MFLFIGFVWGQENSPYFSKIDLFGFDLSTWYILGWFNIFSGKIVLIYYGYKKGWDISQWLALMLFATTGAAIGSLFLPNIIGVLIGFIGCLFLGKRLLGFHHELGTIVALFIAIAFVIGRVGCLINGCCFGSETVLPWGINYPIGTPAHWLHLSIGSIPNGYLSSLSIHPIQLYETIFHLFSAIFIVKLGKRFKNSNAVLFSYFGSYLIFRFFIEFIRDMNNVWWSGINFGPLSLFQWFLLFTGFTFLACSLKLEKRHQPISIKKHTGDYLKSNLIILITCFASVLLFKNKFQTIHLVQLVILIPLTTIVCLSQLRNRFVFFNPIPRFASILIIAFCFSTPIISQIESRLDDKILISSRFAKNNKAWIYIVDYKNKSLLRAGDASLTTSELNRKMSLVNLNNVQDSSFSSNDKTKERFGAIGGGFQRFEISGCGSSTIYTVANIGGTVGKEKKEIKSKSINYSGYRGNIYFSSVTRGDRHDSNQILSLHAYKNIDWRLAGFGLGISGAIGGSGMVSDFSTKSGVLIYPNAHLRIGPKRFNLQAGISDRYHNIFNPMVAHVSLGFKNNLRIGVTNQTPEYPLATAGFFMSSNDTYFMFGSSGISFGQKFHF
jgi:prolipoprotein diacylglyceryltransferase